LVSIDIHPLTPARLADYLDFFDHQAFTDNPHWAGCYCYFYLAPHQEKPWEARIGSENRQAISQCILQGTLHGYLAYVDGQVAGWCHAAPLAQLPNLYNPDDPLAKQSGAVLCFVIAPSYRGQGLAARLLQAALQGFHEQGLACAEARAHPDSRAQDANYHGPLSMYLAAGFEMVGEERGLVILRKVLERSD
jgi:GNAT superfamily N-acetyltransferase